MTKWAQALEYLRLRKGCSKYKLSQLANMPREQYNNMINRSRLGPSVEILDRILKGLEFSWSDWAKACNTVEQNMASTAAERAPEYRTRSTASKTSTRPPSKAKKTPSTRTKS